MIEFTSNISLGNLLTICLIVFGGLKAWYSLLERAKTNAEKIGELTRRINDAELEKLKVCVETMWLFQLRRGIAEVEHKKLGTANSPVKLTDAANALMEPLLPDLKNFYKVIKGEELGIVELAIELEKQFGTRLTSEVCKTAGISDAACLVLAIAQLRPIGSSMLRHALDQCDTSENVKAQARTLLNDSKT